MAVKLKARNKRKEKETEKKEKKTPKNVLSSSGFLWLSR